MKVLEATFNTQSFCISRRYRCPCLAFDRKSGANNFTLSCVEIISHRLAFIPPSCPPWVASIKHTTMGNILCKTGKLLANALGLSGLILKHLTKYLHHRQHCRIQPKSSSSNPTISERSHTMRGKAYSHSVKMSPADSSIATTLTSSAYDRGGSLKAMVKQNAHEIAAASYLSSRLSAEGGRTRCPLKSKDFHRMEKLPVTDAKAAKKSRSRTPSSLTSEAIATPHIPPRIGPNVRSSLPPCVEAKPDVDETAPPLKGIVQQGEAQRHKSIRSSGRVTRAVIDASRSETTSQSSSYQQHIQELEKQRATLCNLKREYGRAKVDYERSENTLQCLRRQDQHPLRFWRKQKTSAEKSLGKIARKLRKARMSESETMTKV